MKATLQAVNAMEAAGVINNYAIGGAVGATFYLEPAATLDIDVFVLLPLPTQGLGSLSAIYDYMLGQGFPAEREHIVVAGWPVQFLPAASRLEEEAVTKAVATEVEGVRTRVMTAEHLAAIALNTGRSKDHARVVQLLERHVVNVARLEDILARHGLQSKWQAFRKRFLDQG